MTPGLSLRVSQHLALTPQLQQSIRLLQLSTLELAQEIDQMLQDNPFLEQTPAPEGDEEALALARELRTSKVLDQEAQEERLDAAERSPKDAEEWSQAAEASEPTDWEGDGSQQISADDPQWGGDAPAHGRSAQASDDDFNPADHQASASSLQAHLHQQALTLRLSEMDRAAVYVLIESLTDDGYLEDDFETLAASLGVHTPAQTQELVAQFSTALHWLQRMEPTGVGARSLAECLLLQLREYEEDGGRSNVSQTARSILAQPLQWLAKRDVKRLASLCKASEADVRQAMGLIARFEPKPGRRFAQVERYAVVPDVIVREQSRRGQRIFVAQLNPAVMPRLNANRLYANALKASQKTESVQGLQNQLQEARWFIKNVQQRFDTILRVSQTIVDRQTNFFKHGAVGMRPLVLREIADEIGMHESTISRVTTAKYIATVWGTFELKYFFGSALHTEAGGIASSTAVRELIKQFIDAENKAKPLSDSAMADMLKEQGIECARRTVAKYREAMRIPVTRLRKTL
jgi:RNA polymerase sigma-54 factor